MKIKTNGILFLLIGLVLCLVACGEPEPPNQILDPDKVGTTSTKVFWESSYLKPYWDDCARNDIEKAVNNYDFFSYTWGIMSNGPTESRSGLLEEEQLGSPREEDPDGWPASWYGTRKETKRRITIKDIRVEYEPEECQYPAAVVHCEVSLYFYWEFKPANWRTVLQHWEARDINIFLVANQRYYHLLYNKWEVIGYYTHNDVSNFYYQFCQDRANRGEKL